MDAMEEAADQGEVNTENELEMKGER